MLRSETLLLTFPMFRNTPTLQAQITQVWTMVRYVWRDSRVPLFARFFVVLAPLYWINPYDLIPDLQPGGYCDDVVIAALLLILAFRLVPKAVLRDSRQAAHLKQKAAAFGMLYVTVTGSIPCPAHTSLSLNVSPAYVSAERVPIGCSISPGADEHPAQVAAKANSCDSHHCSPNDFAGSQYRCAPSSAEEPALSIPRPLGQDLPVFTHSPPILLTTRGGQYQLYASEDASAAALVAKPQRSNAMPPHLAGGIFVGVLRKRCPLGDGSCC